MPHRRSMLLVVTSVALLAFVAFALTWPATGAASTKNLKRYPYLTDVVSAGTADNATLNWATDRSQTGGYATYGRVGAESSTAHVVTASKLAIAVNGVNEYQWKAKIKGLVPGATYAYRVFFSSPTLDLLGSDSSRTFTTPTAPGSTSSFSFAVLGDWGATNSSGSNSNQANLDAKIAASGASFVLSAGDVAYPKGTQTNYGDLIQTGANISGVFAPSFYKAIGDGMPMFTVPGNHGFTQTMLNVWPEPTAPTLSGGRYQMDSYSVPGTSTASYPSVWYAFTVGNARFYLLTAAWSNSNIGTGSLYSDDYRAHWTPTAAEYQWLANDLATHSSQLKFAVLHFPMYSDNTTEKTDTYLHGTGSLAALLTQYNVQMVFNGHAHIYERNFRQPGESFVSYITGGGGATLEPVGPTTSPFDAYGIGWSPSKSVGSATGSAPVPTSAAQVYSFLLVTVNGGQVTVKPTNSLGQTFDVKTYNF